MKQFSYPQLKKLLPYLRNAARINFLTHLCLPDSLVNFVDAAIANLNKLYHVSRDKIIRAFNVFPLSLR